MVRYDLHLVYPLISRLSYPFYFISSSLVTLLLSTSTLGAKRVFYKLDVNGWGEEIIRRDLGANQDLSFYNWNNEMFILFCCLTGCDYLEKVGKMRMGMKTAHKYVSKYRGFTRLADGIRSAYPSDETFDVDEFLRRLYMSLMTFKHQTVTSNYNITLTYTFTSSIIYIHSSTGVQPHHQPTAASQAALLYLCCQQLHHPRTRHGLSGTAQSVLPRRYVLGCHRCRGIDCTKLHLSTSAAALSFASLY